MIDALYEPFADYAFMRRALVAGLALAISGGPLGLFMGLRRMTLMGDAVSHAILPGVAAAFMAFGLSLWPLSLGGFAAGCLVALAASALVRTTRMKEDAAFTLLYLLSLAVGVTLISLRGSSVDLLHVLFGHILGIDDDALYLATAASAATLLLLIVFYRRLLIESFDPDFFQTKQPGARRRGLPMGAVFFVLLVMHLIASFQALGTLMGLGIIVLPALAARFWAETMDALMLLSVCFAALAVLAGLLLSYYTPIPSGPAVVLVGGGWGLLSALMGRYGSVAANLRR